jgi:phage baseplate assembly protein V
MTSQNERLLFRKIGNFFARGIVKLVNDSRGTQTVQTSLMADEVRDGIESSQPYGFTSYPLSGAECIALFAGGNRDNGAVITIFDKRYRPKNLPAGSVRLYDASGTKILLKNDGTIEVTANTSVTVTAPKVYITGDLEVTGNIKATGDITDRSATTPKTMSGMRTAYNTHTHIDSSTNPTSTTSNPM